MIVGFSAFSNRNWEGTDTGYMLKILRKARLECVEIVFAWNKELSQDFPYGIKRWLRGIKHLSIHSPYKERISDGAIRQLEILGGELGAKRFVFHPGFDFKRLKGFPFGYSIENVRKIRGHGFGHIKKELEKDTAMGFCLDTSHTFSFSEKELLRYIENFKGRISHVHLSGNVGGKEHIPLSECPPEFMESLEPIKQLEVPMVLELDWKSQNPEDIKREIGFVKEFLKKK